ncbi:MAG: hypothetical protein MJZ54_04630 [Bacteroidaceae bacterium]|nr:hypothetical protein [Bacteroidaceae bacterium]
MPTKNNYLPTILEGLSRTDAGNVKNVMEVFLQTSKIRNFADGNIILMKMKYLHVILFTLVVLSSLPGCTGNEEAREKISRAESLLRSSPDSALAILDSLRDEKDE